MDSKTSNFLCRTLTPLLSLLFLSSDLNAQATPGSCDVYANYAISQLRANKMIENFETKFRNLAGYPQGSSLFESKFIDLCYLQKFLAFTKSYTSSKIDSMRFVFGTLKRNNEETMYMVPTLKKGQVQKNLWDNSLDMLDDNCPSPKFSPPPISDRKKLLRKFKKYHRRDGILSKPQKDDLSQSVLFPICFIDFLYETCKSKGKAGIMVFNAAYDATETRTIPGKKHLGQSTLVIALVDIDPDGTLKADFKPGEEFFKINTANNTFNHGQLCPTICP